MMINHFHSIFCDSFIILLNDFCLSIATISKAYYNDLLFIAMYLTTYYNSFCKLLQ